MLFNNLTLFVKQQKEICLQKLNVQQNTSVE